MKQDPYLAGPLSEIKLSWRLRWRLRRVRQRHETGLLMQGIIRTPARSMSPKNPAVAIREGEARLCSARSSMQRPKWARLPPGEHILTFHAVRRRSQSSFERRFLLADGDVLVAVCEPIQPWTIFAKSPSADQWHIGVITQADSG
jgi:hypothetical protein